MPANRLKALVSSYPVLKDVDRSLPLAPHAKTFDRFIPNGFPRPKVLHRINGDPAFTHK